MCESNAGESSDNPAGGASGTAMSGAPGRLSGSSSPYLLQHADNPVDWYPWGDEAFDRARSADRPMFISIGYATCHWCHVMERESFENETIASVLNRSFVPVKVDREEHPDVDHFYMTACTAGGRRGGWPLTILALPDGRPFYAATYLPPFSAGGRAGLVEVLRRITEMWSTDRESIEAAARDVTGLVEQLERPPDGTNRTLNSDTVERLAARTLSEIRTEFDAGHGGFGRAPKFPVFHRLRFLMSEAKEDGRNMALRTLLSMRAGGIWDHVGHGFHRYSTDRQWHLPHFEKMLYDQAMALAAYAEAYAISGNPIFRTTVMQLHDMLEADFRLPDGLMASAWDADSEGEEGKYYVWTRKELVETLGVAEEDAIRLLEDAFSIREEGNFTDEATGRPGAANILDAGYRSADPDLEDVVERFEPVRRILVERRSEREPPLRDEKRLTDWNGLYVAGAAVAGRLTGADDLVDSAERTARRLLEFMRTGDGVMQHRKFEDRVGIEGGIDDYAMAALGCMELFEATGRPRWLKVVDDVMNTLLDQFFDEEEGVLRISRRDDIPVSQTRLQDEAYPSGTGIALDVLARLVCILDRPRFEQCLERVLEAGIARVEEWPTGHLTVLGAAQRHAGRRGEIVVSTPVDHPFCSVVRRSFTPSHVHVYVTKDTAEELIGMMPFIEPLVGEVHEAAVFICTDRTCEMPITGVARLNEALRKLVPGGAGG